MIALRFVAKAGMSERLRQQKRIAEFVTDAFLQRTHLAVILSKIEESLNLLLDCDRIFTPRSQNGLTEMIVKRQRDPDRFALHEIERRTIDHRYILHHALRRCRRPEGPTLAFLINLQ